MHQETPRKERAITPDWLVQGILAKIGDVFDRLTGRGWKPSSSLATSELIERLKRLLDAEIKEDESNRRFVPHNIKLKMQWDKFSTDSDTSLKKLENELLTAIVDHINDRRFYTLAPISIEAKPDYFTSGVKLFVGFEAFDANEREAEVNVTIPGIKISDLIPSAPSEVISEIISISFKLEGKSFEKRISINQGERKSVGRTKENDIAIDHTTISKIHASLLLNSNGKLVVADTGSTNGTFIRGERIEYGKAIEISSGEHVLFGLVDVSFEFPDKPETKIETAAMLPKTETYSVGEFEFTRKVETVQAIQAQPSAASSDAPLEKKIELEN